MRLYFFCFCVGYGEHRTLHGLTHSFTPRRSSYLRRRFFGLPAGAAMIGAMKLDNRDLQILTILQAEGRITKSELAARVCLSPAACWDRLKRLDQAGFTSGYHDEVALETSAPASQFLVQQGTGSHHTGHLKRE